VPFPVKIRGNDNINVKGVGQECPTHTGKILGLKPGWILELYAALKRRSSTVLHASVDGSSLSG
jgi:hypothetical protein